jgi:hypothetical protein
VLTLLPLLLACDPGTTTVTGDGVRVVVGELAELVLARQVAISLDESGGAILTCTADDDPDEQHQVITAVGTDHDFGLFGLLADTTYDCQVVAGAASAVFAFTTSPLPDWIPDWTVTGETTGYTLFNHVLNGLDANDQKLLIVDPEGQVRWYRLLPEQVAGDVDSRYLGDGTVLYGGGYGARPRRIDLAGETVYRLDDPVTGRTHHHHAEQLDDGSVLSLVTTTNLVPEQKEDWTGFAIEVVDPGTGALAWSWDSQTAVDAGQLPVATGGDPYHANWTWWTTDTEGPAVWVSLRNLDRMARIDRDTGLFSWTLGPGGDFVLLGIDGEPAGTEDWFYLQHAPELTGDTLVVYDNGIGRPGGSYSRVAMFRLDVEARTLQLLWDWTEDAWKEPVWGDADLLPDGHVLVTRGHCWECSSADVDGRSGLIELDPETDLATWRLDFPGDRDGLYRAQRIDGCDVFDSTRWCE